MDMRRTIMLLIVIFCYIGNIGYAEEITIEQCTKAVMGEARGESYNGQVCLAEALYRRGTLKGVYGYTAKFKYTEKVRQKAELACYEGKTSTRVPGATHWEGTAFKAPYWVKSMEEVATVGNQRFYRVKEQ
jgi:spore germination cell wall hydrolase CwlJ-like protein